MCGLLLLNISSAAWATSHQSPGKPVVSKKSHVGKKAAKAKASRQRSAVGGGAGGSAHDAAGLFGQASFYGKGFQGRRTSTGDRFDSRQFTAASNHFPLGTLVAVHRLDNDRCAVVKVNDRMHARHQRRVIDVSRSVAEYLDMLQAGVVLVRVAPLHASGQGGERVTCQDAFEPDKECLACGQPLRLPDFGELTPSQALPATESILP